jgi:hypothetical protein
LFRKTQPAINLTQQHHTAVAADLSSGKIRLDFLRPKPGNSHPSWLSSSTSEASCLVRFKHLNLNRLLKRLRYFFAQNDEKSGLEHP